MQEVLSQKIIGGWCIGNVIDSAASRSMMHHTVRTAPASMALNINVNVEWWSGDRLHDMYYDSYNITRRSIQPTLPRDAPARTRAGCSPTSNRCGPIKLAKKLISCLPRIAELESIDSPSRR